MDGNYVTVTLSIFTMTVREQGARFMGLLQLRYEHDSSTIRLRFERDTTSYEELCAFEQ